MSRHVRTDLDGFLTPSRPSEAQRVKVGSYFWISSRSRSLSPRARSRASVAPQSCDSRVCSCNGRISRSCFTKSWEDMTFKETAGVITALDQGHDTRAPALAPIPKQVDVWLPWQNPELRLFEYTEPNIQTTFIHLYCTDCCKTGFFHRTCRRFTWFPTSGCCWREIFVLNASPAGTPAGVLHSVPSAVKNNEDHIQFTFVSPAVTFLETFQHIYETDSSQNLVLILKKDKFGHLWASRFHPHNAQGAADLQ